MEKYLKTLFLLHFFSILSIIFRWSFHQFHLFRNFHQPLRKVDYEDIQENWLNGELNVGWMNVQ